MVLLILMIHIDAIYFDIFFALFYWLNFAAHVELIAELQHRDCRDFSHIIFFGAQL